MPYLFIAFIFIAQCILFIAHFAAYKLIISVFSVTSPKFILGVKIIFGLLSLSFIFASLLSSKFYNVPVQLIYTLAVVWLGFLFYLLISSILYFLLSLIIPKTGLFLKLGQILIAFAVLTSAFGILNANNPRVVEIFPKLNTPEAWHGKRAVFISDIHLGQVFGRAYLERIVTDINKLSPDIVLIGGDLFDGTDVDLESVTAPLSALKSFYGTYFITGNHEEFEDPYKYLDVLRSRGIRILNNEYINLDGLQLVGVDFKSTVGYDNFLNTLTGINYDHNKPTILLKHTPLNLDIAQSMNIDLQISGHTHRAQMFPLNFITWLVYNGYDYGFKDYKNMEVYTSSGVGTWGPPLKVGAPSEIVLIHL
jgi:predicted MPP superfamily phosphohydrolase